MSDIRVSVQWQSSTVFAGERIECKITFKNVYQTPSNRRSPSPSSQLLSHTSARERWKETLPLQPKPNDSSISSPPNLSIPRTKPRTHRPAASLSGPPSMKPGPGVVVQGGTTNDIQPSSYLHRKSISIISLAGDASKGNEVHRAQSNSLRRPGRGHTRAASLQVLPRRTGYITPGPLSGEASFIHLLFYANDFIASANDRATTMPSPFFRSSTSFAGQGSESEADHFLKIQRSSVAGSVLPRHSRKASESLSNFKFPRVPASTGEFSGQGSKIDLNCPLGETRASLYSGPFGSSNVQEQLPPSTVLLSPTSINGTPRSSGDFYSMSNNSTETLASEYVMQQNSRQTPGAAIGRQISPNIPTGNNKSPEILMMGYGQITGSYTLDGSLVDQSSFEEVKRKGIIGSQGGGGVVRSDSVKRDSGFFGAFGWKNFGDSLGGLLGGNELSSIKETDSSDSSRSIPILSTPQAILFVNLQLAPGESKTYSYSHPLPKAIPPTHKGKAIKVAYSLVVGTQRAAKAAQQHHVRHVDVPFRVLPSVNSRGEIFRYDLMSPYVMLHNDASISIVLRNEQEHASTIVAPAHSKSDHSFQGFLSYVENILVKPRKNSSIGLLSPTESGQKFLATTEEEMDTVKDAIDHTILQSNSTLSSKRSPNRFEITRSGHRVAVIMLTRPAYRLGETITVAIDFRHADVSCHSLITTLETSESINPAIALRSNASVQRATRRIHASQSESTIFATRAFFNPIIPGNATPGFITSGVTLEWKLRFEFVTSQTSDGAELHDNLDDLMEEVARDDRGIVMAAVQGLPCETFDVTVPLQIYGATAGFGENNEISEIPI